MGANVQWRLSLCLLPSIGLLFFRVRLLPTTREKYNDMIQLSDSIQTLHAEAKIDASIDIFAFGILMWEMFSAGVRPYPRLQPDKIPRAVYRGARPSFSDEVPSAYRNLALACWSTDPHRRPRASDVVVLLNGLLQELE
ncbi:hypothetical protein Vretifemale_10900 [Volvox reticuliferus]|uniref:Serine-threonine/tyrosine-protein kinase catalytic domain-containing protein n=1 Tax=Volvox reticuliferus TaxID=1737510 RepID=A0A8J4FQM3_9CHLO|nr:hypothetical protein Vretifemale_10900 [Volvox reticuliferus]